MRHHAESASNRPHGAHRPANIHRDTNHQPQFHQVLPMFPVSLLPIFPVAPVPAMLSEAVTIHPVQRPQGPSHICCQCIRRAPPLAAAPPT